MRLPAWTSLLGPPVFAAICLPLLLLVLALAVPSAGWPRDASTAGRPAEAGSEAAIPVRTEAAPAARPAPACSPMSSHAAIGGGPASPDVKSLLSKNGELSGHRLEVATSAGHKIAVNLPTDSFVGEPAAGWLVYSLATADGSDVRGVDLETGCDARLAHLPGVARAAVLAADGAAIFVHAVDAATRADLGVARVDLASGDTTQAVPAFDGGNGFGPVYATTLAWASDGPTLVVQSCGALSCQTRLFDTMTGAIATYADPHGALVGATAESLYVFEAGYERPAALLGIARVDGTVSVVAADVFEATFDGSTATLRYETAAGWQEVQP